MAKFQTTADITLRATITVEADNEDGARAQFKAVEWVDDGMATWAPTMELVDWEAGDFTEVDEYGKEK